MKVLLFFKQNVQINTTDPSDVATKIHHLEMKHFPEVIQQILSKMAKAKKNITQFGKDTIQGFLILGMIVKLKSPILKGRNTNRFQRLNLQKQL